MKPPLFAVIFLLLYSGFPVPAAAQNSGPDFSLEDVLNALNPPGVSPESRAFLRWDPFFGSGVISAGEHSAAFFSALKGEEGPVVFDNREFLNLPLPYSEEGELRFPETFVAGVKTAFNRFLEDDFSRFRVAAVVIDPGHGGRDSGAVGNHVIRGTPLQSVEKDIVLKVSLLLYDRLKTAFPDKRVLLTRENDMFPSLDDRVNLANNIPLQENEAIIYISVHANSSLGNRAARGYEIWYLPPGFRRELLDQSSYTGSREVMHILNDMMAEEFTTESILLAQSILSQFDEFLGDSMPSRGLKEEAWFVVRKARMPSVLVELGFVSNETDALLMNDEAYLKKFSEALYAGIAGFIAFFERSGGFTSPD